MYFVESSSLTRPPYGWLPSPIGRGLNSSIYKFAQWVRELIALLENSQSLKRLDILDEAAQ